MKAQLLALATVIWTLLAINSPAAVRYVDLNSTNAMPPYADWSTAATNINDAVDASSAGDHIWVSNGVYRTGSRPVSSVAHRVAITKAITVQSVNPLAAWIDGGGSNRCVYLASGATLAGFVVTSGYARQKGGGIFCASVSAVVSNCSVVWNLETYDGGAGVWGGTMIGCNIDNNQTSQGSGAGVHGDTYPSVLINCSLRGNSKRAVTFCNLTNCVIAGHYNGGAESSTLDHCTITNNSAFQGAGVSGCTLYDCVLSGNSVISGQTGGGAISSTLYNCIVSGNSSPQYGGGAAYSSLYNCYISGNSAGIYGGGADNGTLSNCTLIGNTAVQWSGGGAINSTLNYCTVSGNSAGHSGGGAIASDLNNCLVINNSAGSYAGGGVSYGTINNCTIVSNTAPSGGGTSEATLNNCIVYYNRATSNPSFPNYLPAPLTPVNNCCTVPIPTNGVANITNEPNFVNLASSDFRLQTNSPCINSGKNSYITNATDLDGNPRIVGGTVDIGVYEFQSPSSLLSYAWAQQNGLPTDGSADFSDSDGDGANNWQEWRADTIPINALSVLRMVNTATNSAGVDVTWQSVPTRNYWLERATNLGGASPFQSIATDVPGGSPTTTFTDTGATNAGPYFYRAGVQ